MGTALSVATRHSHQQHPPQKEPVASLCTPCLHRTDPDSRLMAGLNTTTANMAWVSLLVLLLAHSTLESPKKARGRPRIRSRNRPQVQNDQPMTDVGRGRRAPQSEYDYAEDEDYLYADGDYDGAYYYDEEYNAGGDGPSRGDQSLVSPEIPGGQIVRITSKNRPGYYWSIDEGIEGYLMTEAEMFRVVSPGLWGEGSISFESTTKPGRYIRHRDGKIWIEEGDTSSEEFRRECSWFAKMDHFFSGFISFESVHQPGWFVRHNSRRLELSEIYSNQDRNDASFIMSDVNSGMEVSVGTAKTENWKQYVGKTVEVESKAVPGHFWQYGQSGQAKLEVESHVFKMVDGLWGENTVSFESTNSPGFYLRARGEKMWVEKVDLESEGAKQECSFNVWDDRFFAGYTSFESANNQDQWIRQKDRELMLDTVSCFLKQLKNQKPPPELQQQPEDQDQEQPHRGQPQWRCSRLAGQVTQKKSNILVLITSQEMMTFSLLISSGNLSWMLTLMDTPGLPEYEDQIGCRLLIGLTPLPT